MQINRFLLLTFFASILFFTACDDEEPFIPTGEEVITTVRLTFTEDGTTNTTTAQFQDLDGVDGNPPVIETINLAPNTNYTVAVEFLNESVTPVEDITAEVKEEDDEHQVFFELTNGLNISGFTYADQDGNGAPLGLLATTATGDASTGNLTITLIHEPQKDAAGVADGDKGNAGGETDVEAVFPLEIN